MRFCVIVLISLSISMVHSLDWREPSPPKSSPRVSPEPHWQDLDIVYPTRYHSPPLGPLLDHGMVHLNQDHFNVKPRLTRSDERDTMRRGVSAMMDRLLSIRRLPGEYINYKDVN